MLCLCSHHRTVHTPAKSAGVCSVKDCSCLGYTANFQLAHYQEHERADEAELALHMLERLRPHCPTCGHSAPEHINGSFEATRCLVCDLRAQLTELTSLWITATNDYSRLGPDIFILPINIAKVSGVRGAYDSAEWNAAWIMTNMPTPATRGLHEHFKKLTEFLGERLHVHDIDTFRAEVMAEAARAPRAPAAKQPPAGKTAEQLLDELDSTT